MRTIAARDVEFQERPDALIAVESTPEPQYPRALLEGKQGALNQTLVFGNAGRPALVAAGQVQALLRLRADDPLAQTAIIALEAPSQIPAGTYPYAIIEWGTDGVTHHAVVDFLKGQQLSVSGSWVQVVGGNESGSAAAVVLGASGAYGFARGNAITPTRTLRHGTIANGNSLTFVIPRFAVNLYYYRTHNVGAAVTISIRDAAGAAIADSVLAAPAGPVATTPNQQVAIPIPSDGESVRITSTGANTNGGRLIFGLAL